jgi:hypothetical protein
MNELKARVETKPLFTSLKAIVLGKAQTREINTQLSNKRSALAYEKFQYTALEIAARNRAGFIACRKVLNVSRGDKKACPISQVWLPGILFLWFSLSMFFLLRV